MMCAQWAVLQRSQRLLLLLFPKKAVAATAMAAVARVEWLLRLAVAVIVEAEAEAVATVTQARPARTHLSQVRGAAAPPGSAQIRGCPNDP